jgi:hypothetical protein
VGQQFQLQTCADRSVDGFVYARKSRLLQTNTGRTRPTPPATIILAVALDNSGIWNLALIEKTIVQFLVGEGGFCTTVVVTTEIVSINPPLQTFGFYVLFFWIHDILVLRKD